MTTGRKLRLALGAAILAALFAFVVVGHAGVHAGSTPADPPCAMCGPAAEAASVNAPEPPVFADAPVLRSNSALLLEQESVSQHRPRGPPLAG